MCSKGCTDCCNAVFDLSFIEAAYMLTVFKTLFPETREKILEKSLEAEKQWQKIRANRSDPSFERIACPMLNDHGQCSCYSARPINCRTYGVPTIINGTAHVCGLSKFLKGTSYPTINLAPLQKSLYEYSTTAAGEQLGRNRWPVSVLLLHPDQLIVK